LTADFVFDTGGETVIELSAESTIAPTSNEGGEAIELHNILRDALSVAQVELLELSFGVSCWVVGTEVLRELEEELVIVI
jgi:hypothetical protein